MNDSFFYANEVGREEGDRIDYRMIQQSLESKVLIEGEREL